MREGVTELHTPQPNKRGETLKFLRRRFGDELALQFIERFSGRQFVFSSSSHQTKAKDSIEIMVEFGPAVLNALRDAYSPGTFTVPTAREFRVAHYDRQGLTINEIASRVGCCHRTVSRIRAGLKARRTAKFQKWKEEAEQ